MISEGSGFAVRCICSKTRAYRVVFLGKREVRRRQRSFSHGDRDKVFVISMMLMGGTPGVRCIGREVTTLR